MKKTLLHEKSKDNNLRMFFRHFKRKVLNRFAINYKLLLILVFGLFLSIYTFYTIFHYLFLKNHFDPVVGVDGKSCPACFGNRACPYFFRGEINIKGIYRLPFLQKLKTRQIFESYHGLYHRKTEVVIKKLATNKEHVEVDLKICDRNQYRNADGKCFSKHALWYYLDYHPSKSMQLAHLAQTLETAPMMHCVTDRLFKRIKQKFRERDSPNTELALSRREEILLLYILSLNQQPLILQLFPAEEGWPFPKYLGACGRWIVEEHAGIGMDNFCNAKIWQKITILINFLKLPKRLNKASEQLGEWALYIGDPDPENFMIDPITFDVKIVDLEHMLVVDIKQLRKIRMENSHEPYHVKPEPCGNGLTDNYFNCTNVIDKGTLCSRESSDHNIHSICAMLLSSADTVTGPGCLLNDHRLGNVKQLLKKCVYEETNRVHSHNAIMNELNELLHSLNKEDL